ncbi:NAD(P)/FAD-dependent oxidoreductase [Candidatus Peregrinibacteria bacterium]|nr:NAD(P)/FAD-dependent oxidoreductase [Candidatus Peregrinibacteria bacterium]
MGVKRRKIVVLGAGYAGIRVMQDLLKKNKHSWLDFILVDRSHNHVFQGDLYEVATAFNKKITDECLFELKDCVAIPIESLLDLKRAQFICDEVIDINHLKKKVILKKGADLSYDYLVVALGSCTNYYGIRGLKEHSFPLKTAEDALAINCHLDKLFKDLWQKNDQRHIKISVGGGGATGVETACELTGSLKLLCKKYGHPLTKVQIQLIEGLDTLLGLDQKGTWRVMERLKALGVKVYLERYISKVSESEIELKLPDASKQSIYSDVLIWTGGVMVSPVVARSLGSARFRGAIEVNPYLQSNIDSHVFAAGDNAYFKNSTAARPLPMLAQTAVSEGKMIAENLLYLIEGRELKPYQAIKTRMVVPLGGKYALFKSGDFMMFGFWAWVIKRLVYLKYALSILSVRKAYQKWRHSNKIFIEND